MNFETTIELLEAEIDSLKDCYKTERNKEMKTIYSSGILEHKKAITFLKNNQAEQLNMHDVSKRFYCQDEYYDKKEQCSKQCVTCFSKE